MNHDLIVDNFSKGSDLSPEEINKAGANITIKHSIIRVLVKGRSQENKGLWSQLICSMGLIFLV